MSADITWRTTHGDTVEVYAAETIDVRGAHLTAHDAPPQWRYRVRAANNRIVETGSEGYTRRRAAITAALRHHPRVEVRP